MSSPAFTTAWAITPYFPPAAIAVQVIVIATATAMWAIAPLCHWCASPFPAATTMWVKSPPTPLLPHEHCKHPTQSPPLLLLLLPRQQTYQASSHAVQHQSSQPPPSQQPEQRQEWHPGRSYAITHFRPDVTPRLLAGQSWLFFMYHYWVVIGVLPLVKVCVLFLLQNQNVCLVVRFCNACLKCLSFNVCTGNSVRNECGF